MIDKFKGGKEMNVLKLGCWMHDDGECAPLPWVNLYKKITGRA